MFFEIEMSENVVLPPDQLFTGLLLKRAIILKVLEKISYKNATREHGYFIAVTSVKSFAQGIVRNWTGEVVFHVVFNCITFKPIKGEILRGTVERIFKHGVLLSCGPVQKIFLSKDERTMPNDYQYVPGENDMFLNEKKHLKIIKDGEVRFKVWEVKWDEAEREFQALASLDDDFLGPIDDRLGIDPVCK